MLSASAMAAMNAVNAQGNTIQAQSCSLDDVERALNRAEEGSTVRIPAGTCSWSRRLGWTAPPNVTVLGAGDLTVRGGADRTVIVDDYRGNTSLVRITTNREGTFRLAGITFRGGDGTKKNNRIIQIGGLSKELRFDHNTIDGSTYSTNAARQVGAVRFVGWVNGVVDENHFRTRQGPDIWMPDHSGAAYGDGAWAAPTALGSSDFIFIEDNDFSWITQQGAANDCFAGGRFVFRHNTLSKNVQTHPTGGARRNRGCRAWEIYKNNFVRPDGDVWHNAAWLSSGTGVIWGNSVDGFRNFVTLHSMRKNNATYRQSSSPNGWGYCGTQFNGIGSNWDGNTDAVTGYPCLDQPGRGNGDLLANTFPNVKNTATQCSAGSPCAWPRQADEPIYEWSNAFRLVRNSGGNFLSVAESAVLQRNKDFYLQISPFNGSSGVGVGALADRPSSCTTGVAYWATGAPGGSPETLYKCTATNTWTEYYRPYTYPHPLTGRSPAGPAAPANVRVIA
jgi:hypothetical protein